MDSYIHLMNVATSRSLCILFADDVLLLARTITIMQQSFDVASSWASDCKMNWSTTKSCVIELPSSAILEGVTLATKEEEKYLGICLGARGLTETKLLK